MPLKIGKHCTKSGQNWDFILFWSSPSCKPEDRVAGTTNGPEQLALHVDPLITLNNDIFILFPDSSTAFLNFISFFPPTSLHVSTHTVHFCNALQNRNLSIDGMLIKASFHSLAQ
jgi:hypothetical protein